ncbi:MAG: 3-deoxy-7-phosphoheptulonate synthase [Pleurocapsa sp. MO_192.B19]|nr:3-deoxy-7-phosphoheptulonate synthase [Pleurocapsa sp. MO_192.B19]
MQSVQNCHVQKSTPLATPQAIKAKLPISEKSLKTVLKGRDTVKRILQKRDPRLLAIVGPCSIHNPEEALEYAQKLNKLRQELEEQIVIVMRVYFEKPRTSIGWKGLIKDPYLNDSHNIETGLSTARNLLLELTSMGLFTATEFLDPIVPQYLDDLIVWAAIGARTTESPTHREMASGLSMPVGFKNGTDGDLSTAINAIKSAMHPHHFLGINPNGQICTISSTGNSSGHIVLRGGRNYPNYDFENVQETVKQLISANLMPAVMVDCSHGNSGKQHTRQEIVWRDVLEQRLAGNNSLTGLMLESYLQEGKQAIPDNIQDLRYGLSVTDACIGWEQTERILRQSHTALTNQNKSILAVA